MPLPQLLPKILQPVRIGVYQRPSVPLLICMTMTTADSQALHVAQLRKELARHEAACGCELGSVFAIAALAPFVGRLVMIDSSWSMVGTVGRAMVWVVGCSLVGKLLGLAWARVRVTQLRAELRAELRRIPSPHGPALALGKD